MQNEMGTYADLPGLKAKAAAIKVSLEAKVKEYTRRRDMIRQQVQMVSADFDKRKAVLARDPHASALDALETKIKNQEQAVFGLKECKTPAPRVPRSSRSHALKYIDYADIATTGRESDYEAAKKDAMRLCAEVNLLVRKAQLVVGDGAFMGGGIR
jgi:hypothetical protein